MNNDLRIVFMGTPDFATTILDAILKSNYNVVAVVTSMDKPAGRGLQLKHSSVKTYALAKALPVLQPLSLKDEDFTETLSSYSPNLFIVVAFRMLPKIVWKIPKYGTFNLHASLLPNYRGAAPINHVIINGERETGVTTFFIDDKIDTGKILMQETVAIREDETAGELHDKLMHLGADLVLKTIQCINNTDLKPIEQNNLINEFTYIQSAPKLTKEFCKIDWNIKTLNIYNFIRGLSPYPTAFTVLYDSIKNEKYFVKIFECDYELIDDEYAKQQVYTNEKTFLKIKTIDGYINVKNLQIAGKRSMNISDFLKGFKINNSWSVI